MAVPAPVDGEALAGGMGGPCKDEGIALAALVLEEVEDRLVVEDRVVVVHLDRVRAVKVGDVDGDALAKIRLERVDAHRRKPAQVPWNQVRAAGFVKSTIPIPGCHWSVCQTVPSGRLTRKPFRAASAKIEERWPMYGFIQTQIFRPRAWSRFSMPAGSGKTRESHWKSHQSNSRIQKQSKWKTLSGRSRAFMPSMKPVAVFSS